MTIEPVPVDRLSAEHYVWGGVCDGWHLLKEPELSVIQERVPAVRCLSVPAWGSTFPPGTAHRLCNAASQEVTFLVISAPSTAGDRSNL